MFILLAVALLAAVMFHTFRARAAAERVRRADRVRSAGLAASAILLRSQERFGHGAFVMELDDVDTSLLPESLDDIRGRTPEELTKLDKVLEAHMRSMHQTDTGELRDLDEAEQSAFDLCVEIRNAVIDKLENHAKVAEVLRRRPEAVKRSTTASPAGSTTATASCG
jgi:hypothetical protein